MKPIATSALLILILAACSGARPGTISTPGQGAVAIEVIPNPIVAIRVSGDTYDFPFEVVVRETGGRPINVTRVSATVYGPGGLSLGNESWDADRIRSMGYSTAINANGELRYRFTPRRSVGDDRLFSTLSAELKVEAVDDTGAGTSAKTVVTIRR